MTSLITGTDFVFLPITSFEKAEAFYGGVLGLTCSARYRNGVGGEFETGSLTIAIMQSDAFGLDFAPHTHPIALQVDDVHAARAELEEKGIEFAADTIDSGVCHMAPFTDPDGNSLMFHHRYAPPDARPNN